MHTHGYTDIFANNQAAESKNQDQASQGHVSNAPRTMVKSEETSPSSTNTTPVATPVATPAPVAENIKVIFVSHVCCLHA
jgi:hypothetical protein